MKPHQHTTQVQNIQPRGPLPDGGGKRPGGGGGGIAMHQRYAHRGSPQG